MVAGSEAAARDEGVGDGGGGRVDEMTAGMEAPVRDSDRAQPVSSRALARARRAASHG